MSYNYTDCPPTDECRQSDICELAIKGSLCVNEPKGYRCECPEGQKPTKYGNERVCEET